MAKTELTLKLEKSIYTTTQKKGVFRCFEVTVGFWGEERVDFMTYDTQDVFRCYEIKVSKSDFHSKAKKSFVGHYNYYVMPKELYEQVKNEIPKNIGVYIFAGYGCTCVKKSKKMTLKVEINVLKDSMIRSLSRETEKYYAYCDPSTISNLNKKIRELENKINAYRDRYQDLRSDIIEYFGTSRWKKKLSSMCACFNENGILECNKTKEECLIKDF